MATSKRTSTRRSTRKAAASSVLAAPSPRTPFASLAPAVQRFVASRIIGGLRQGGFFGRSGYKSVWGDDQLNRRWQAAETGDELQQLTASERNRLIALARNTARNSDHMEGILNALANNVIGTEGGKATFTFPEGYERQSQIVHREFARWAKEAEYFDDQHLQSLLRLALRALYIGGDMAFVFDDGLLKDSSGQVISFEADCIGDIDEDDWNRHFAPRGYTQHQGVVKNANGKTVGVIVSWSQRGQSKYNLFDEQGRRAAWVLLKDPQVSWEDTPFTFLRKMHRVNQMRGASPLWSGLGTIADGADLQGYEIQAAKRNAQVIAQVMQTELDNAEGQLSSELDPDAVAPITVDETDDEQSAAVEAADAAQPQRLEIDSIKGAGVIYDVMPPGLKMELFDTKHPNNNLVEFSRWMHSGAAYAAGLTSLFAIGKADASYSAAMAEMILAQTQFRVEFQTLEREFLDWIFAQWSKRAQALNIIPQDDELPEDWRRTCVQWQHPAERALNPVDEQNAIALGLKNLTRNYHETLGPDWKRKLMETAEELEFARAHGIPDPRMQTASGMVIESTPQKDEKTNE